MKTKNLLTALAPLLAAVLLAAGSAQAASPVVIDNGTAQFSTTGTWPTSTSVTGFEGANYQSHEANGTPPGAIAVDNTDAGFSVTGTWPTSTSVGGFLGSNYQVHGANGEPPTAVAVDNLSGTAVGTWPTSTSVGGYYGTNYQTHAAGTGTNTFTWTLAVPSSGTYQAYARWTQYPNRASNAKYTVNSTAGATVVTVNQAAGGGSWFLLGTFSFDAGNTTVSLSDDANGYVIADAVMLVPPGAAPNTATWSINVPTTGSYQAYARWTQYPNRATNAQYTVNNAAGATPVTVNQMAGGGNWSSLGTFTFNAGTTTITLTDQADGYVIADSVMLAPAGTQPNSATWTPNVSGQYEVYAKWTASGNRATNATYTVTHASGATPVAVNQQLSGGTFNLLGTFNLTPSSTITLTDQANGYVIADAIELVFTGPAPQQIYYISTDQLNTPRVITDGTSQVVWRWDQGEPFGSDPANSSPSGAGSFEFNPRFPGQYFDKESNLNYNYFRDYDPASGRYEQSDPTGLMGGINTYTYVENNPLASSDPSGQACISVNGRTTCAVPGGPVFTVSTPPGFPKFLGAADNFSHLYRVERPLGCASSDGVIQALINNPTPGNPLPATPGGTTNNARVTNVPINNWVTSYSTVDVITGAPIVVNIAGFDGLLGTKGLFGPGYVARYVQNGKVITTGEGTAISQSLGERDVQKWANEAVWGNQMEKLIQSQCGCNR